MRRKSVPLSSGAVHPIVTPSKGVSPNTGPLATAAWLLARGLTTPESRWHAEILVGTSDERPDDATSPLLRVEVFSEEWGFAFWHQGLLSWIRVTDLPFVHGRDEHGLLAATPALRNFGDLVRTIESRFELRFVTDAAVIRSSLLSAESAIRAWIGDW